MYDTRFGGESGRSPAVAVVEGIAAVENAQQTELDPLFDQVGVDLDALNGFFDGSTDDSEATPLVRLTIAGWNVFVRGDGAVRVCDPDVDAEPSPVFDRFPDNFNRKSET